MITKPSISTLVQGQLPEFIRDDYQTFIAFLEAYYQFLEQNLIDDFDTVRDIDTTLDSFIQYFKDELAVNFPAVIVDERNLYPKLKQIYTAKGTEDSFKTLFKLLYNKNLDILYPSQQILRISDGKWNQSTSIFVNVSTGDINSIIGQKVIINSSKIGRAHV